MSEVYSEILEGVDAAYCKTDISFLVCPLTLHGTVWVDRVGILGEGERAGSVR